MNLNVSLTLLNRSVRIQMKLVRIMQIKVLVVFKQKVFKVQIGK